MTRAPWILFLLLHGTLHAQDYVTPEQFGFTVESGIEYGTATNYLGHIDTLRLDLYKPTGNTDTKRPLLVFAHGGSWLGGCKDEPLVVVPIVQEFVQRGYVVASINYRLGWHKAEFVGGNVAGFGISPWPLEYRAYYPLDSAEIKRAIYRGQQDMKGAIRFLKARADQDSVCVDKVFVGGESAGAFVALAAAFLDRPEEKPAACGSLPEAPEPYALFLNATAMDCELDSFTVDANARQRPDLGPVDGTLNINGQDARVRGVASFYGGLQAEAFEQDWWLGVDTPAVHLYHRTCDGIVLHQSGKPMRTISQYCNLGAAPWHPRFPTMRGSGAIKSAFDAMGAAPAHSTDFLSCAPFNPALALLECPRYGDNGSYHNVVDRAQRCQNLAVSWAPLAGDPSACLSTGMEAHKGPGITAYPNPFRHGFTLRGEGLIDGTVMEVRDALGRVVQRTPYHTGRMLGEELAPGTYMLTIQGEHGPRPMRIIKQ